MNRCLTCGAPSTAIVSFPTGTTLCRECLIVVWEDEQEERKEAKDEPVKIDSDDDDEGDIGSMEEGGEERDHS